MSGYLESLSGAEYRTDVYTYNTPDGQPNGSADRVHLSTAFTSYAIRKVLDSHPDDLVPGLPADKARTVRFSYAAESHSFGYNTHAQQTGTTTPTSRTQAGLVRARVEDGTTTPDELIDLDLPIDASHTTHTKSGKQVNDYAQTTVATAHGRPGVESWIATHSHYNQNEAAWIHRVCETYVQGQDDNAHYNHKRQAYDSAQVTWSSAAGSYACAIGAKGQSTSSEVRIYYEAETPQDIQEHVTAFNRWGLPTHTKALKKLEGWVYYEDPRGYQALPTREVIRVGTNESTADYPETAVKYLTTRVSYDPGLGAIVKYWDENNQESRAVYDTLGRITAVWAPREPKANDCGGGGNPTFMKAAQVEYHLTTNPTGQPYSYVKATTYEDACDPTDVKEAWSFADGFGRVRMTIGPGDNAGEYIGSGHVEYDAKGAARFGFAPAFLGLDGQPPFDPSSPALPGPIVDTCPFDDDSTTRTTVCKVETKYDAFGSAVETTLPNGVKTKTELHGPLVTKAFDGNDVGNHPDDNAHFQDTPTTSHKDGHGRLIAVALSYKDKDGNGSASYFRNYHYNVLGNLTHYRTCKTGATWSQCSNPDHQIEKLQHFDSVGRRREINDPNAGVWKFAYDESGNIAETTDGKYSASGGAAGNKIGYQYDDANRLVVERCIQCERRPAGDILARYFYDSPQVQRSGRGYMSLPGTTGPTDDEPQDWVLGRLTRIEDDTGWVMFSYDRLGRQVTEAQHIEGRIDDQIVEGNDAVYIGRVEHDDAGRITRLVYPAPSNETPLEVQYAYNRRSLTTRVFGPDPLDETAPIATHDYLLATHSEVTTPRASVSATSTATIPGSSTSRSSTATDASAKPRPTRPSA